MVMAQLGELRLSAICLDRNRLDVGVEHCGQPVRIEDLARNLADHDRVQLLHRRAQPAAARRSFLEFARAAVVALEPTLAGVLDHGGAAIAASGEAREEGRAVHDTRRRPFRATALHERLNLIESRFLDYCGNMDANPL